MKKKYLVLSLTLLLGFALMISGVYAIGINPSRIIIDFEPNLQKTLTFNVINNEDKQVDVEIYVRGDLKDYVTLKQTKATLASGEIKSFSYEIKLPSTLEKPGIHDTRIGAVEAAPIPVGGGAQVGARVGVEMQVWVQVPYPGKYASISLDAPNVKVGDVVNFKVSVQNLGTEDFTASDEINVFSADGGKVATVFAGSTHVKTKSSGELFARWDTNNVKPGLYVAKANVKYNGASATAENSFSVGGLVVNILDVFVGSIQKDSIGKITIKVESLWNDKIENVFAELFFFDKDGKEVGKVKSESIDLAPSGKADITAFWDTKGLPAGKYEIKVVLHYADKTEEKTVQAEITAFALPIWLIAVGAVAVIVIGVIIYFVKIKSKPVEKTWKQRKRSQP
jgi:hypothetical protein